jgi:O-antigen ligase
MLTSVAPFIVYLLSFPVMLATVFRVEIGILYFITFVPIISVMQKISEFPQGNNFADFLLIAIALGWFLKRAKENRSIFERSPVNLVVIAFLLGSTINLITGYTYMGFSDYINHIRLMTWKNYMILPFLYFIAINNVEKEDFARWIIICICLTMLAMDFNFYTTFRWYKGEHYSDAMRISGAFSFLGPNELGVFYSYMTFLLLGICYFIEDKKIRYFVLLSCACNFYPIVYSFSRAAYSCTFAGFLVLGILKDRRLLIVLFALAVFYRILLPNAVVERIDMTFLEDEQITTARPYETTAMEVGSVTLDTVGRKELWEKAENYFKENPLLGIGFNSFRHKEGIITHSLYWKILAEQGLLGMMIFIIFSVTILRQAHKLFRHSTCKLGQGIGLGVFVCTITTLVGGISGDQSLYYNVMAIYWLFVGIVASFNIRFVTNDRLAKDKRT